MNPQHQILSREALARALALRDLTDPSRGPHALQLLIAEMHQALARRWGCRRQLHRGAAVVSCADNYDRLGYPPGGAARDGRYSRWIAPDLLLRSQTSAAIPGLLNALSLDPPEDLLLVCPGLVYRRDSIDRLHCGEPHQLDLWRLRRGRLDAAELGEMVSTVMAAAVPGSAYRLLPSPHPYTSHGMQIDVRLGEAWVEVGECGLADPALLARCGLDPREISGLAMGLGLDRLLMVRKGIPDIRLLRSEDPRVAGQMLDLAPYRPVSDQPPLCRDLSLAVAAERTLEELGDRTREVLGPRVDELEALELLAETAYAALPAAAVARLGMHPGQKNALVRLTLRHPTRSLTDGEGNALRDAVYAALHEGDRAEWAVQRAVSP